MKTEHFACHIDLCNAAFDGAPMTELVRILREIAGELESGDSELTDIREPICDINGNRVGHFVGEYER